jgi:hypothetical protein
MGNWISVDDTMPKNQQPVLIAYTTIHGKKVVTMGWYARAGEVSTEYFDGEVNDEYDEEREAYFLKEQWVDESIESEYHYQIHNVTHWMPMPAHPTSMEKP